MPRTPVLEQERKTSAHRIDLILLIELHCLLRKPLPVLGIFLLYLLQLWLQFPGFLCQIPGGTQLLQREGEYHQAYNDGQDYNGQT